MDMDAARIARSFVDPRLRKGSITIGITERLLLVHELGSRLLQMQRDWLDDVEKELRE
jgi:hypothetical protein